MDEKIATSNDEGTCDISIDYSKINKKWSEY